MTLMRPIDIVEGTVLRDTDTEELWLITRVDRDVEVNPHKRIIPVVVQLMSLDSGLEETSLRGWNELDCRKPLHEFNL